MPDPSDERLTLKLIKNHAEFKKSLQLLAVTSDLDIYQRRIQSVALGWLRLGRVHLTETAAIDPATCSRAIYSRAYYAAYNASKAVRYMCQGAVSLKGDDHRKVADLPDSFPNVDHWVAQLPELYEHRLRADYDNWGETGSEQVLTPEFCIQTAAEFVGQCENFLNAEYGVLA